MDSMLGAEPITSEPLHPDQPHSSLPASFPGQDAIANGDEASDLGKVHDFEKYFVTQCQSDSRYDTGLARRCRQIFLLNENVATQGAP